MSDAALWSLLAFLYTSAWLDGLVREGLDCGWYRDGVVELLDEPTVARWVALALPARIAQFVEAGRASELAGVDVSRPAVYFPSAGTLAPRKLCEALLRRHPSLSLRMDCAVERLTRDANHWQLWSKGVVIASAEAVVLANAADATSLLPELALPITKVRGQLTYLPRERLGATQPARPLCGEGYAIPLPSGDLVVGATYDRDSNDSEPNPEHHRRNVHQFAELAARFAALRVDPTALAGRVSFRAATRDYRPIVGAVPDPAFFEQHYADLHHGRSPAAYPPAQHRDGLFLNVGHGSRGLVSCPLAAEVIADLLSGVPAPLPGALLRTLNPARFLVQRLRRSPQRPVAR